MSVDRTSEPQQVQFSGDIVGESAMHSEVDVGSQIIHKYEVVSISTFVVVHSLTLVPVAYRAVASHLLVGVLTTLLGVLYD